MIRYHRGAGEEKGRWSFEWDGPAMLKVVRDLLIIAACIKFLM